MAISTTQTSVSYNGSGSAGPFPIPFPFLDPSFIFAGVAANGEATPVLLSTSAYTVSGSNLTLVAPITAPQVLVIFRQTPLTQPTVFQPAGPFPAKANETALDRLCMQVQELSAALHALGGGGGISPSTGNGILTWTNAAARGSVAPQYVGQLGVEQATQTVWIAQSTAAGAWQQFDPRFKGHFVIGCFSNTGHPESDAAGAAARLTDWDCDAILAVGDISVANPTGMYDGRTNYDNDWLLFQSWINSGSAFPALGDCELDYDGWAARQAAKFPYIAGQNGSRYYKVTLGGGLIDLFVLDSGVSSAGDVLEPDGNTVSSVQHAWFVAAVAASTARWRIAAFHISPTSLNQDSTQLLPAMAWPELEQVDLICCGHVHALELIRRSDTLLVGTSTLIQSDGNFGATIDGASSITDRGLWADDSAPGLARIVATENYLETQIYLTTGACLHSRLSVDLSKLRMLDKTFTLVGPSEGVGDAGTNFYVHRITTPMIPRRVGVSVTTASGSTATDWQFLIDSTVIASGTLAAHVTYVEVACSVNQLFNPGQAITFTTATTSAASGLEVTIFYDQLK